MTGFEWAYYSTKDMEMLSNKDVEVSVITPLNSVVVPHEKGGPKAALLRVPAEHSDGLPCGLRWRYF
jgi:hypothetical protein